MYRGNFVGLFTVIPVSVLLTISYFVLLSLRKVDSRGLKNFGYAICILLWLGVLLMVSGGIYSLYNRTSCPMMKMGKQKYHKMMWDKEKTAGQGMTGMKKDCPEKSMAK